MVFLLTLALPLTTGCSSDDDYYNQKAIAAADSLAGYWLGDEAQTWWFLEKGDTSAYQHSIVNSMLHFQFNSGSQTEGTCTRFGYGTRKKEWIKLSTISFTTDGDNILLKQTSGTTDTLKLLNHVDQFLSYSQSGKKFSSNVVFQKLDISPSSITPGFYREDFYDDEESNYPDDSTGYWQLDYVADYNQSADEIGSQTDVSDHGLYLYFHNGKYEMISISDDATLMSGDFRVAGNILWLSQTARTSSDDSLANTAADALARGCYIQEFGTSADDYSSYVHFNLLVNEGGTIRAYGFVWSHGSMSSKMKGLKDIIDKYKK